MNYRVRAVRVKQHDEEERVHPERSALVGCPERNTLDAPSSSDGPRPVVCTNYWSRIKQDGYVADRTADRDCFPDYLSIILLWYYCFILVRVSHADFDDHNGRTEVRRWQPYGLIPRDRNRITGDSKQGWYPIGTKL